MENENKEFEEKPLKKASAKTKNEYVLGFKNWFMSYRNIDEEQFELVGIVTSGIYLKEMEIAFRAGGKYAETAPAYFERLEKKAFLEGQKTEQESKQIICKFEGKHQELIDAGARQERAKFKKMIEELKTENPYPEDVFPTPSDRQLKSAVKAIKASGITSDSLHGSWARYVWGLPLDKLLSQLSKSEVTP